MNEKERGQCPDVQYEVLLESGGVFMKTRFFLMYRAQRADMRRE
jgi:hypothetical protein